MQLIRLWLDACLGVAGDRPAVRLPKVPGSWRSRCSVCTTAEASGLAAASSTRQASIRFWTPCEASSGTLQHVLGGITTSFAQPLAATGKHSVTVSCSQPCTVAAAAAAAAPTFAAVLNLQVQCCKGAEQQRT